MSKDKRVEVLAKKLADTDREFPMFYARKAAQALIDSGVMDEVECHYRLTPDGKHCGIPQCGPCRHNAAVKGWVHE